MMDKVTHTGGCHCKRIRYQVKAPSKVVCWDCNCSYCSMLQNQCFMVPSTDFELEEGAQQWLTEYTFDTNTAKHIFCKICESCSYYVPRAMPDGIAVRAHRVDPGTIKTIEVKKFDGLNFEAAFAATS